MFPQRSAAKVVEVDLLTMHAQVFEHLIDSVGHGARSTHIILDIFRSLMIFEVHIVYTLMDKSGSSRPIIFRLRVTQGDNKAEVGEVLFYLAEVLFVDNFTLSACSVPISDFAPRLYRIEKVQELSTKGSHPCPTADIKHLGIAIFMNVEVSIRTTHRHLISRLEREDI